MKTRILSLAVIALVAGGLFVACKKDNNPPTDTTNPNVNLKQGLLVYLPFDNGSIGDSSGNHNVTTAKFGAAFTSDADEVPNNAFYGTANGAKIVVKNTNGSITWKSEISISSNFLLLSHGPNDFISYMDNSTSKGFSFGMGTGTPGKNNFGYGFADSTIDCTQWGVSPHIGGDTTSFIPELGTWYNEVITFQRDTMKLYINGSLISKKKTLSTYVPQSACSDLNVGGWWDGDPGASLNGKLDEFRLYNRVLNADEIAELSKGFRKLN